jgi:hypothetical protein
MLGRALSFVRNGSVSKMLPMKKHISTASLNPSDLQLAMDSFGQGFGHLQHALPGTILAAGVVTAAVANEVAVTVSGVIGASGEHLSEGGYFL